MRTSFLYAMALPWAVAACGTVTTGDETDASPTPVDGALPVDAGPPPVDADPSAPDAAPAAPCRVAWYKGGGGLRDVWTSLPDGTDSKPVTTTASDDFGGEWSPRGDRLLFSSKREGNFDVFLIAPDGSQTTNLTKGLDAMRGVGSDTHIGWSPDGNKIAFLRDGALWVMASDGALATQLSVLPNIQGPQWSPDGRSILLSSRRANESNVDLYLVPATGGQARQITTTTDVQELSGIFSPDGAKIVFSHQLGNDFDVWMMAADGSGPVNLTPNTPNSDESIGPWTLDGAAVIITSDREGSNKLFRLPVAGGALVRITDNALSGVIAGEWPGDLSPDGRRVLFTRYMDNPRDTVAGSVALDGTDLHTWPADDMTALATSWSPGPCGEAVR